MPAAVIGLSCLRQTTRPSSCVRWAARELRDRGEIRRVCVCCPPHLCGQWREELTEKFHLPAAEVRPGPVTRLDRDLPLNQSVFDEYPYTVVSIDYIKSDRRRASFL